MITHSRVAFKPFVYESMYGHWLDQQNAHWLFHEIDMKKDVQDWDRMSVKEKNVVGNILKGFAQTECEIGDYWSSKVPAWFPVPEVKAMAQTFGAFETIHAIAYSYLNDTLGLTDFEAFLEDEATMKKLGKLMEINSNHNWAKLLQDVPDHVPHSKEIKAWAKESYSKDQEYSEIARSIALFSAASEGVILFSSFAVLMSFKKEFNMLQGVSTQMIYSVRDESLHSKAGCELFRIICKENPQIWTDDLKNDIYEGMKLALEAEFFYIDKIFEMGDLESINKAQVKNFICDRANRKLIELGLESKFDVNPILLSEMDWFYSMISGESQDDFFNTRETNYSKANEDWNDDIF